MTSTLDDNYRLPPREDIRVPSVGRIVHYLAYGTPGGEFPSGVARAAIVTAAPDARTFLTDPAHRISLCVLNPTGFYFNQDIPHGNDPGCWRWPAYEPRG